MNKLIILLLVIFNMASSSSLLGQELYVKWSDKNFYDNKLDGFFKEYMDANSTFLYVRMETFAYSAKRKRKIAVQALDPETMKKVNQVTVFDPTTMKKGDKLVNLKFFESVVFEDVLYLFYLNSGKEKDELYVQTFNPQLKKLKKMTKIYEVKHSTAKKSRDGDIFVVSNNETEKIIIGSEHSGTIGSKLSVEYKLLKEDLSVESSNKVQLPFEILSTRGDLMSRYILNTNNSLFIQSMVKSDDEDDSKSKNSKYIQFPVLTMVDIETGNFNSLPFKFQNKNIFDYRFTVGGGVIKFYGFFCDTQKDPKGRTTHGIFSVNVDESTFTMNEPKYTYFKKQLMDELFKEDKKDQVVNKKKRKKGPDENSIANTYGIEDYLVMNNGELILFCSIMYNYAVTTCDSKGNCVTRYYCNKRNVTVFKITPEGELEWAKNINRSYTYSGWDIYDVNVTYDNDKDVYYTIYENAFVYDPGQKKSERKKKKEEWNLKFEYAVLDAKTGSFERKYCKSDRIETPRKDRKWVKAVNVDVVNNEYFASYTKMKRKVLPSVLVCAGSLVCPYLIIFWKHPNLIKAEGYFAKIDKD